MGLLNGILTFLVFTFNFILFLIAIFLIYIGLFGEYPIQARDIPESDGSYSVISNVILSLSVFVGVLSFMGCYGVATDSKLYLLVYSTTLLLLIVVQLFFGYGVYSILNTKESNIENKFVEIIKNQTLNANHTDHFMHEFQRKHKCCGFESHGDWLKVLSAIPGSCCGKPIKTPCLTSEVLSKPPCEKILKERMNQLKEPLMHFIIAIFVVEALLGVFTACIVISKEP